MFARANLLAVHRLAVRMRQNTGVGHGALGAPGGGWGGGGGSIGLPELLQGPLVSWMTGRADSVKAKCLALYACMCSCMHACVLLYAQDTNPKPVLAHTASRLDVTNMLLKLLCS